MSTAVFRAAKAVQGQKSRKVPVFSLWNREFLGRAGFAEGSRHRQTVWLSGVLRDPGWFCPGKCRLKETREPAQVPATGRFPPNFSVRLFGSLFGPAPKECLFRYVRALTRSERLQSTQIGHSRLSALGSPLRRRRSEPDSGHERGAAGLKHNLAASNVLFSS